MKRISLILILLIGCNVTLLARDNQFSFTLKFAAARSKTAVEKMLVSPEKSLFCPMNDIRFQQRDGKLILFGWVETIAHDKPLHLKWGAIYDLKSSYVEMATFDSPAGTSEAQIGRRLGNGGIKRPEIKI